MDKLFENICKFLKCKRYRKMEKDDITLEQLEKFAQKGAIIIDVRSPQEYNEGHIDNAICIPNYEIEKKIGKVVTDFNKTIILYCSTGARSKRVQKKLKRMGYINVYNLIP